MKTLVLFPGRKNGNKYVRILERAPDFMCWIDFNNGSLRLK